MYSCMMGTEVCGSKGQVYWAYDDYCRVKCTGRIMVTIWNKVTEYLPTGYNMMVTIRSEVY